MAMLAPLPETLFCMLRIKKLLKQILQWSVRSRLQKPDFAHHTGGNKCRPYFDGGIAALFAAFAVLTVSGCHVLML
jgi:hypothetical protein